MEHFNKLTPAEDERLALLMEECGEVIQVIGKILRHGYESTHPNGGMTNRQLLEAELGDLRYAIGLLIYCHDLSDERINDGVTIKAETVWEYLHHQG